MNKLTARERLMLPFAFFLCLFVWLLVDLGGASPGLCGPQLRR
jgi:hypothetical protein